MVLDTATQVGHMLRTKLSHVNEGGVAAGIHKLLTELRNFDG